VLGLSSASRWGLRWRGQSLASFGAACCVSFFYVGKAYQASVQHNAQFRGVLIQSCTALRLCSCEGTFCFSMFARFALLMSMPKRMF